MTMIEALLCNAQHQIPLCMFYWQVAAVHRFRLWHVTYTKKIYDFRLFFVTRPAAYAVFVM